MNPASAIALSTIRLEASGAGMQSVGTGYCYLFEGEIDGQQKNVPVIITNKHVVAGASDLNFQIQIIPENAVISEAGTAKDERPFSVHFQNLQSNLVMHPDQKIDLCAIPIGQLLYSSPPQIPVGFRLKNSFVTRAWHLPKNEAEYLRPIEPILMIGYPNGLWDPLNNRPIFRQGTTASHALLRWIGNREFVIDAACFPGSSGSPVFLFEDGMFRGSADSYTPGTRIRFLGTLWGGPVVDAKGRLEPRPIPTSVQDIPVISIMMNLGYVVHASALDDIEALFFPQPKT